MRIGHLFLIVLVACVPPRIAPTLASSEPDVEWGRREGTQYATDEPTGGWMIAGVATGIVTPLVGTAIVWGVAGSSGAELPLDANLRLAAMSPNYRAAFQAAYAEQLRARRQRTFLLTSATTTVLFYSVLYIMLRQP